MFYEPDKNNHGLPHNPFKSICVPRPIAWISSLSKDGVLNVAPFSQFTNLSYDPPYIVFSAGGFRGGLKDTVRNIWETNEFVVNMATWELREKVELTSQPVKPDVDEAKLAGLEMIPSRLVKPPRIAASPIQMECRYHCCLQIPGNRESHYLMVGRVHGVHIKDDVIGADGKLDILQIRPLARLGYLDYTSVESFITIIPTGSDVEARIRGLSGTPQSSAPVTAK